jgi:hypothetical protein
MLSIEWLPGGQTNRTTATLLCTTTKRPTHSTLEAPWHGENSTAAACCDEETEQASLPFREPIGQLASHVPGTQNPKATAFKPLLTCDEGRARLSALEQVGVVAALAQLHHHVEQAAAVRTTVERINVFLQQGRIPAGAHTGAAKGQIVIQLIWTAHTLH